MLFPVLQRFYGGRWEDWEIMPIKMLSCYIQMLPVIKAEETLLRYQAVSLGMGPKSKRQVPQMKRQVRELVRTMQRFSGRPKANRAASFEDMQVVLASMGIKVKMAGGNGG